MLVLSRRPNEEIIINEKIRIVVVRISKDQVKLGIDAPKDVIVDRGEIHEMKIQQTFTSQDTSHDLTQPSQKPKYAEDPTNIHSKL